MGHLLLLLQACSKDLSQKWGSQDQCSYGLLASQMVALHAIPQCWSHSSTWDWELLSSKKTKQANKQTKQVMIILMMYSVFWCIAPRKHYINFSVLHQAPECGQCGSTLNVSHSKRMSHTLSVCYLEPPNSRVNYYSNHRK